MQPTITPPLPTSYFKNSAAAAQTNTVLHNPGAVPNRVAVKLISVSGSAATTFSFYSGSTLMWQWQTSAAAFASQAAPDGEYLFLTNPGETLNYSTTGTNNTFVRVNGHVIQ